MVIYNKKLYYKKVLLRKRKIFRIKDYSNVKNIIGSQYIFNSNKGRKVRSKTRKQFMQCKYAVGLTKNQMLNLLLHLGYKKRKWLKAYSLYIYMVRNGIIIFNLDYIQMLLNRALRFMEWILFYKGKVFSISHFVNVGFKGLAEYFFKKLKFGYYDGIFQGGLVSNFFKIRRTKRNPKKPYEFRASFVRFKFNLPSMFLIFDTKEFFGCLRESSYVGVPALSIVDSDVDYRDALYPVVGNSDNIFFNIYILLFVKFLKNNLRRVRFMKYLKLFLRLVYFYLRYRILIALIRVRKVKLVFRYLRKYKHLSFRLNPIYVGRCFKVILNEQRFFPKVDIYSFLAFSLRKRALFLKLFLRRFRYKKYKLRLFWFWYFSNKYNFRTKKLFPIKYMESNVIFGKYQKWMKIKTRKFLRFLFRPKFVFSYAVYKKILASFFGRKKFTFLMLQSFIRHKFAGYTWVSSGFRTFFTILMPKLFHIYGFIYDEFIDKVFLGIRSIFFKKRRYIHFNFVREPDLFFEFKKKYDFYSKNRLKLIQYRREILLPHRHNKRMAFITRWLVNNRSGIKSRIRRTKFRKLAIVKYVKRISKAKAVLRYLNFNKALEKRKKYLNRVPALKFSSGYFLKFIYMHFLFIFNNYRFWSYTEQSLNLPSVDVRNLSEFSFVRNVGRLFHQVSLFKEESVQDVLRKTLINHAILDLSRRYRTYLLNTRICWQIDSFLDYVPFYKIHDSWAHRYVWYGVITLYKRLILVKLLKKQFKYVFRNKLKLKRYSNVRYFFGKKRRIEFNKFDFFRKYYYYALYSLLKLTKKAKYDGIKVKWNIFDIFYKVFFKSVKNRMDRVKALYFFKGFKSIKKILRLDPFLESKYVFFFALRRVFYDLYIQSIVGFIYDERVVDAFRKIEDFHRTKFRESYDDYQPLTMLYDRNSSFFQKVKKLNFWSSKFRDTLSMWQWEPILKPFSVYGKPKLDNFYGLNYKFNFFPNVKARFVAKLYKVFAKFMVNIKKQKKKIFELCYKVGLLTRSLKRRKQFNFFLPSLQIYKHFRICFLKNVRYILGNSVFVCILRNTRSMMIRTYIDYIFPLTGERRHTISFYSISYFCYLRVSYWILNIIFRRFFFKSSKRKIKRKLRQAKKKIKKLIVRLNRTKKRKCKASVKKVGFRKTLRKRISKKVARKKILKKKIAKKVVRPIKRLSYLVKEGFVNKGYRGFRTKYKKALSKKVARRKILRKKTSKKILRKKKFKKVVRRKILRKKTSKKILRKKKFKKVVRRKILRKKTSKKILRKKKILSKKALKKKIAKKVEHPVKRPSYLVKEGSVNKGYRGFRNRYQYYRFLKIEQNKNLYNTYRASKGLGKKSKKFSYKELLRRRFRRNNALALEAFLWRTTTGTKF